jgi:hypothetical protein
VYEVYFDGTRICATGPFGDNTKAQIAHTRVFPVPARLRKSGARILIALRARTVRFGSVSSYIFQGGSYQLSDAGRTPWHEAEAMTDRQILTYASQGLFAALLFSLGLLIAVVWLAERDRLNLFWLSILLASRGLLDARLFGHISLTSFPLAGVLWAQRLFTTGLVYIEAAKTWGQNDDITVVTVRRNA